MGFTKLEKDVLNISKLPDSVKGNAKDLKATFDKAGEDIKKAHNDLIDELEEQNAASKIGAISEEGATTVQAELDKLNERIHIDFTELEIEVDDELNLESGNAVQNKVITKEINAINGDLHTIDRYNFAETSYEYIEEPKEQTFNLFADMKEIDYRNCENNYVKVTAVSTYSESYSVIKMFNSNENEHWYSTSTFYPGVGFTFKKPIKAKKIRLRFNVGNKDYFKGLSILGSKDGTDFKTLYETTVYTTETKEITLQNTDYYQYYYLEGQFNGSYFYVYDFQILEWEGALFEAVAKTDVPLSSYQEGKMINIEVSDVTIANSQLRVVKEFTSNIIPIFTVSNISHLKDENGCEWYYSSSSTGNYPYNAFDNSNSTGWYGSSSADTASTVGIYIEKKSGINSKFAIKPKKFRFATTWNKPATIYGRRASDGKTIAIGTVPENNSSTIVTVEVPVTTEDYYDGFYLYVITSKASTNSYVYNFEIIEGTLAEGVFENKVDTYFYDLKLDINNLGSRLINTLVNANKKYNLMYVNDKWNIGINTCVTGKISATSTIQTVHLGFKPDLVLCYANYNNDYKTTANSSDGEYYYMPRVLSDAYKTTSDGCIVEDGFTFRASTSANIYYIAIKV